MTSIPSLYPSTAPFDQSVFNNPQCLGHLLINGGGPSLGKVSEDYLIRLHDKGFAWIMMVSNQLEKHQYWHLWWQSPLCFRKNPSQSVTVLLYCSEGDWNVIICFSQLMTNFWKIISVTMEVSTLWKQTTFPLPVWWHDLSVPFQFGLVGKANCLWLELF